MSLKDKTFNISDFEEGIWLVKVPLDVYKQVVEASDSDVIGLLEVNDDHKNNNSLLSNKRESCVIKMKNKLEYKLNKNINSNVIYAFKEDNAKMIEIANKNRANMLPLNEKVNQLLTKKLYSEKEVKSEIRKLDINELEQVHNAAHGKIILDKNVQSTSKNDQNLKRTRGDRDEIKHTIFRMFEDKEYISRKEFFLALNEPHDYILEILDEICDTHQVGKKSNLYKLKKSKFGTNDD